MSMGQKCDAATLVMMFDLVKTSNQNKPSDVIAFVQRFKLKNIDTGRTYKSSATRADQVAVFDVPQGTYCLYSVNLYVNMELEYCKSPNFRVEEGKINNAGKWRLGYSYESHAMLLVYAFKDPDAVISRARETDGNLFK